MAQGGIKKGFFFYFGLFVLLLIAIFCICLVIMMFNPGKSVLWMQYFSGNNAFQITETSDLNQPIDWKSVNNLEIDCGYANVVVERNKNGDLHKYATGGPSHSRDGIYVINNAKGFTTSASAKPFSCKTYFENGTLKVVIQEPTGFLYFSKEVKIILHATTEKTATNPADWDFSNLNLTVTTTDGDISIGGAESHGAEEISLAALECETKKGDIAFTKMFKTDRLTKLKLKTEDGTLSSASEITYSGDKKSTGIGVACGVTLDVSGRGKIGYDVINAPNNNVKLTCKSGSWNIGYLNALETRCVNCVNGNYLFGTVNGKLNVLSEESLISPNIRIKSMENDFFLDTRQNNGSHPDVEIEEAKGSVSMLTDKGSLKIKKAHGALVVESYDDLKIDVTFAEDAAQFATISNKSGNIRLAFLQDVFETKPNTKAGVYVVTESGKVDIYVTDKAKFVAEMYVSEGSNGEERQKVEDGKIDVNIGNEMIGETKNPLNVNPNMTGAKQGTMEIVSASGKISFKLEDKEKLAA